MMKNWMIAGLMGATALTGIAPLAATAAEQDRTESRWNDRRTAPPRAEAGEPARQRGETLEQMRKSVDLSAERQQFAGDSALLKLVFGMYVQGSGIAAAYQELTTAEK